MDNQFVGQILLFSGNYAPYGWALCNGQLLPISSNTALFSILGTNYGGDGKVTFGLPDLRGRVPSHASANPVGGAEPTRIGETKGTQNNTLLLSQLPMHTHAASGTVNIGCNNTDAEDTSSPSGAYFRQTPGVNTYAGSSNGQMGASNSTITVAPAGSNLPMNNQQPALGMTYIIALSGTYPQRP